MEKPEIITVGDDLESRVPPGALGKLETGNDALTLSGSPT